MKHFFMRVVAKGVTSKQSIGAFALTALLAACGGDSSSGTKAPELAEGSDIVADTFDDLTICSDKREGATAYVKDEKTAYVCEDGDWIKDNESGKNSEAAEGSSSSGKAKSTSSDESTEGSLSDIIKDSFDDLPVCTDKREGATAYVKDEKTAYVCENGDWTNDDDSGKDPDPAEGTSSSSAKKRSSSSSKEESSSSIFASETKQSSSSKNVDESSSSIELSSSSVIPGNDLESSAGNSASECSVTDGVKVVYPKGGETFKMGDTITVVYGSDVQGSGYRFVFKTSEDDVGLDMLEESAGPETPDGKTCYEQKVVLTKDVAEATETAIIRVVPYEKTAKGANSGRFKVTDQNNKITYGTMTDSRDNKKYKTVTIGDQTWMAENLNYAYTGVPYKYGSYASDSTSWCYGNDASNCAKYGRLYTWAAAIDSVKLANDADNPQDCGYYGKTCDLASASSATLIQGVCPPDWHLPTYAEWNALFTAVGGSSTAGKVLKSQSGWNSNGNGTDAFGFSALPAGYRDYGGYFTNNDGDAYFWSSTEDYVRYAFLMNLHYNSDRAYLGVGAGGLYDHDMYDGFSVRCVKD